MIRFVNQRNQFDSDSQNENEGCPVNGWIAFPCMCRCRCKSLKLFRLPCPVLIHAVNISSGKTLTTPVFLPATNVSICIGWGQITLPQLPRHHFVNASWTQVVLKIRRKEYWQLSQRKRYGVRRRDVEVIGRNIV